MKKKLSFMLKLISYQLYKYVCVLKGSKSIKRFNLDKRIFPSSNQFPSSRFDWAKSFGTLKFYFDVCLPRQYCSALALFSAPDFVLYEDGTTVSIILLSLGRSIGLSVTT